MEPVFRLGQALPRSGGKIRARVTRTVVQDLGLWSAAKGVVQIPFFLVVGFWIWKYVMELTRTHPEPCMEP